MKHILLVSVFSAFIFLQCGSQKPATSNQVETSAPKTATNEIIVGAARFEAYLPLLKDKTVAMVVNQTSEVEGKHIVDWLLEKKVNVKKIFAPEHGFRGTADAGEKILSGVDEKTGLPLISLYGKDRKPSEEHLKEIDVVIFDIQDVGARFYTYISTMHYVMEACAEQGKKMIVLDRPNPNGDYVDGFVLDMKHQSFVGMHPIPVVHGLTVGELAQMINGEGWLANKVKCALEVIKCENYTHKSKYSLPIKPSPNLPNDRAVYLYPSLCFFEGTIVSLGRGTDSPFQVVGYPDYPDKTFSFTPKSTEGAKNPPLKDQVCYGVDLRQTQDWKYRFSLHELIKFYKSAPDKSKFFNDFINRLAGTDRLKKMIEAGKTEEEIRASWQEELVAYKQKRKKYLLYEDFE
ncbi:exo-beta-N-acetylmuramidase NamZ family protein [Thermoflexibacter ruber]|uniref:Uncharacterized conserved protein YbbC, DUF1343 family n=1 Tax=Thermoflexibacter ruber TaxID=1003 RepID=A0A1I2JLX6_9BACT|nr:DUF1343 domain-containing protein [Thermoflexibacter ruber]SFF55842.1 Uncharacterized conserved protein YbbC, DUF1343 family [Thermoflexibacter ruber]